MSLIRFRKKSDQPAVNPAETEEAQKARIAVNESLSAARAMLGTKEFQAFKQELAEASRRTIDLLIQIDDQETDPDKFSVRVRNVLHKIKFLRSVEVIVETRAGEHGKAT